MRFLALLFCAGALCFAQQGYSVETLAGTGVAGFAGDNGLSSRARLNSPGSLTFDSVGRLYIADTENHRVRRVDVNGRISTVAELDDYVTDIAVAPSGTLYIATPSKLRTITATGETSDADLPGITALAVDSSGTPLVAQGNVVSRLGAAGAEPFATLPATVTSLFAGPTGIYAIAGTTAYTISASGAPAPVAGLTSIAPNSRITADRWGDLYVSGVRVTKLIQGKEYPLTGLGDSGYSGDGGPAISALVNMPTGIVVDRGGNVFFSDTANQRVRLLRAAFAGNFQAQQPPDRSPEIWPKKVVLSWNTFPQDTNYDVFFGTAPDNLTKIGTTRAGTFALPNNLDDRKTYYWQVRTQYAPQPPTESAIFSFTTTTSAAIPPPAPSNPAPANNSSAQSVAPVLSWTGSGAIQYIFWFGTAENSLAPLGQLVETTFNLNGLAPETTYYWQIVAVNEVGVSRSPIWNFTTGPQAGYPWIVETVAGAPLPVDDGLNATDAVLNSPRYPTVDVNGNIYFVNGGNAIRRIGNDGKLSTLYTLPNGTLTALNTDAANGTVLYYATPEYIYRVDPRNRARTYLAGQIGRRGFNGDNGTAAQALFDGISSLASDRRGNIYIADPGNNRVRVLNSNQVRTFAGTGNCAPNSGTGPATSLDLCSPSLVFADSVGNVYVYAGYMLIRIGQDGVAQRIAGDGTPGYSGDGGPAVDARLGPISGLAVDRVGFIYLADSTANTVRIIDQGGTINTWAGAPLAGGGFTGDAQLASDARFASITGIALDPSDYLVIADTRNHRIRRLDGADTVRTAGGGDTFRGDRGRGTAAWLYGPTAVAVDGGGNVFVADSLNDRIRRVTNTGMIDTVAGGGSTIATYSGTGRDARDLRLDLSTGATLAMDERGNLLFNTGIPTLPGTPSDAQGQAVITILPNSIITAMTLSQIPVIGGVAKGRSGELYVSDTAGHRIWRINPDGSMVIFAGTGSAGSAGDGGQAVTAQLNSPRSLALDSEGNLFVAEVGRIRKLTPGGGVLTAAYENATGLAFDRDGVLYVSGDRFVYTTIPDRTRPGVLTLVRVVGRDGGTPVTGQQAALDARTTDVRGIAAGPSGELVFADYAENAVRRLTRNTPLALQAVSGDGQTVGTNNQTKDPLAVKVIGRTGVPVSGVTVRFYNVTAPSAPVLIGSLVTNGGGLANFYPYLPQRVAEIRIEARVFGVAAPASYKLTGRTDTQQ